MKASSIAIFLLIALSIYSLINFYIFRHAWQALSGMKTLRFIFLAIFLFLVLSYPAARFAERLKRESLSKILIFVGAFYLALMIHLLLLILLLDIARLGNKFLHYFPSRIIDNPQKAGQITFFVVGAMALIIVVGGIVNALHLRVRTLDLTLDKPAAQIRSLNIVLVSDIHLGRIVQSSRLEKIVERINGFEPDIVLMPGDIADESLSLPEAQKMAAVLQKIHARYGVFSSTGNHEYYGGLERNLAYLRQGKIKVLMDEALKVDDSFYVIGRKDPTARQFGEIRKPLAEILEGVDPHLPLILLDHQPVHLEEAEQNGIDLELSGHTHNGQLFPFNLIIKFFYENSWGYLRKGKTQYYVSCGVGTWGPPMRTASVPEIVQIKLRFK